MSSFGAIDGNFLPVFVCLSRSGERIELFFLEICFKFRDIAVLFFFLKYFKSRSSDLILDTKMAYKNDSWVMVPFENQSSGTSVAFLP